MITSDLITTPAIAKLIKQLGLELAREYGANFSMRVLANDMHLAAYDSVAVIIPNDGAHLNEIPTMTVVPPEKYVYVTLHRRMDNVGWQATRMGKEDSPLWDRQDKGWIKTLLESGDETLIVGDCMYQAEWKTL